MNGLEKITHRIAADARAEADRVLAEARAQAQEITADFDRRADEASKAILAEGELQAKQREERMESMAELEGRKLLLAEKQTVLDEAFTQALDQLKGLDKAAYTDLLTRLLVKASVTHKEEVKMNEQDRAQVGKDVIAAANSQIAGGALTLSETALPISGGFVLSDGPVEVNCSLNTLLEEQKERLTGEVASILFPQA